MRLKLQQRILSGCVHRVLSDLSTRLKGHTDIFIKYLCGGRESAELFTMPA